MSRFHVYHLDWRDGPARDRMMEYHFRDDSGPEVLQFPRDYNLVAKVECDDIDEAYHLTNHISAPWWANRAVELIGAPNHRSTSVGDVIHDTETDTYYACAPMGWDEFEYTPASAKETAA